MKVGTPAGPSLKAMHGCHVASTVFLGEDSRRTAFGRQKRCRSPLLVTLIMFILFFVSPENKVLSFLKLPTLPFLPDSHGNTVLRVKCGGPFTRLSPFCAVRSGVNGAVLSQKELVGFKWHPSPTQQLPVLLYFCHSVSYSLSF